MKSLHSIAVAVLALGLLGAWGVAAATSRCPQAEIRPIPGGWTVVTWIPSEAAPGRGIVVRLTYPESPRYPEGTAAVVEVPGADSPGDVELPSRPGSDPLVEQGLIGVKFAFPGGGRPPYSSSGTYDHRGLNSLKALRDVVRFLRGEIPDEHGCYVSDLLPYPVLQVGLVGSSNGGNTAIVALGLFGDEMAVDWYVGWENPAGVQFTTVDLGSRNQELPFYSPCSCRLTPGGAECDVDYTHLRWDPQAISRGWGPQRQGTRGVLYHDLNGNGRYDQGDYVLGSYPGTFAGREKRVYSTAVLEAAVQMGLIDPWPQDVATLEEAREYWAIRDMSRYYDETLGFLPGLRVIVIGSERDHVQVAPDHPHILLQYKGWREAGVAWVRLNSDAAYVEAAAGRPLPAVDNPANIAVDCENIRELLQPEAVPDSLARLAAVLELSDRVRAGDWRADLDDVLRETSAEVTVDAAVVLGTVNPLSGVQGGPRPVVRGDADLSAHFRAAGVDHVRLPQDTLPNNLTLGGIFPDPQADPDDPSAYDFSRIDPFIEAIVEAGIEPLWEAMYDLGRSDRLTRGDRGLQRGIYPHDPAKWATVIKNVLKHFNDGWADGHHWGVEYVEFINEPFGLGGCRPDEAGVERCWDLFQIFVDAIHAYEAETGHDIKIVGPAEVVGLEGLERTLDRLRRLLERIRPEDLDYLSVHPYGGETPEDRLAAVRAVRELLDTYRPDGKDFSHVGLWASEWQTGPVGPGARRSAHIGAFNTAVKILWQGVVDRSTLYRADRWPQGPGDAAGPDGQVDCSDVPVCLESPYFTPDGRPKPAYFPWLALAEMARETPLRVDVTEHLADVYVLAARNAEGTRMGLLLARPALRGVTPPGAGEMTLALRLRGLPETSPYSVELYRIDADTVAWEPESTFKATADPDGNLILSVPLGVDTVLYLRLTASALTRESAWVVDEEGHEIYAAWWRPPGEGPFPCVIFVPAIGPGVPVLDYPEFRRLAEEGFVVASFNPEGRGRPGKDRSEGEETCQGPNQQEDLKAVIEYLAELSFVDTANIGIASFSGGSLLAGPALGRWPELPVAYWIDVEGPHDGSIILGEPCGHPNTRVDPSPENKAFWRERSPIEFIANFRGRYLRVQAEIDHAQGRYVEHALEMNNAAVEGGVPWVRINGADAGNPINRTYPLDDPSRWPEWLPGRLRDQPGGWRGVLTRYAREMAALVASQEETASMIRFERVSEEPVLGPGTAAWESMDVLSCEVLYDPDEGLFKMWYTGFDGERYAIGYAESRDGLHWERYPGNPVLASMGGEWDRDGVGFPAVVQASGKYYMFFTMLKRARAHRDAALGLAISDDGIHWERVEGPILLPGASGKYDARALVGPDVFITEDRVWHMLYAGGRDFPRDPDGCWAILHAESTDGTSWRVDPVPVLTGDLVDMEDALNPEVLRLPGGTYWLAFAARVEHSRFHIFSARSRDGLRWELASRAELLTPGAAGRFDEKALNHPALVLLGDEIYLFYTGYDRHNRRAIGLATASFRQ